MNQPQMLKTRAKLFSLIREFFNMRGFIEVDTPALVPLPSQEPYLSPMEVRFSDVRGNPLHWYLTTSPEFAIKKLLAEGVRNVYQLSHVFRGGEAFGGVHNPEFMMLEWYRTPGDYENIMRDVAELICYAAERLPQECHAGVLPTDGTIASTLSGSYRADAASALQDDNPSTLNPQPPTPRRPFKRLTVTQAFLRFADLQTSDFQKADWIDTAKKFGHTVATADDAFFALFLNLVERKLPKNEPVFITDYPLFQAALAKTSDKDPRVAERFELYWGGLELANAFSELVEVETQKARFKKDQDIRRQLGKPVIPIDPDFLAALKKGFPPTGGIALGVDRLLMLLTGAKNINEVLPLK